MRNEAVSISKAIAILLMVLAHASIPVWGQKYINMFHMPLFFFFAGYCFKDKYLSSAKDFVKKKISGIYFPFVKWCLLFLLLHNIFFHLNIYNGEYGFRGNVSKLYSFNDFLVHAFNIITRMSDQEQLLGGFWFLKSLFWASLFGFVLIKRVRLLFLGGGIALILSVLCIVLNFSIPFFAIGQREFLATFFFIFGYLYHVNNWEVERTKWIIPVGIILLGLGVEFWQCSMLTLQVSKILPYSCSAIIGTLTVLSISHKLSSYKKMKELLVYIGDNTLPILTWHFLSFKIVTLLIIIIYGLPIQRLAEFPVIEEYAHAGWWAAYFIVGVVSPLLLLIFGKHLKSVIAKHKVYLNA